MNIFNIKLKHMGLVYAAFILVSLYGCGDTTNQSASGYGTNIIASGSADGNLAPKEDEFSTTRAVTGGYLPSHCPVEMAPVEPVIGCSEGSFAECSCWDPTNPAQVQ